MMTYLNFYQPVNRFVPAGYHTPAGFRADIEENDEKYRIQAELPGIGKEQLTINVEDRVLTINADFNSGSDESAKALRQERQRGKSSRRFILPDNVEADAIEAEMKNGLLTLSLPKKNIVRQISIK